MCTAGVPVASEVLAVCISGPGAAGAAGAAEAAEAAGSWGNIEHQPDSPAGQLPEDNHKSTSLP